MNRFQDGGWLRWPFRFGIRPGISYRIGVRIEKV